ncbi:nucleotide exchange factor GrpE [Demequina aestuarii]|uniref:nucleotide exchange factor GrpE n=1 Tax=Demequina aestuarii TaxID=327095 RepID=UPI000783E7B2|nr:nucleotide exchange factor GrpE [Demequina aestuarii]
MTDNNQTPDENPRPDQGGDNDPLADAEAIVNEAAAGMNDGEYGDADADEQGAADAIDRAQQMAAEHLADLQRLQAEYVNYRKRVDRDREAAGDVATAKVVEALIPALDDIVAAREHGDLEEGPFKAIAAKVEEALGRFGWSTYGAAGEEFSPQLHEALMSQPSADVEVPTVQHVAQPGHRIGERVVRPARVIVSQPE